MASSSDFVLYDDQREHIYKIGDTEVGGTVQSEREEYSLVFSPEGEPEMISRRTMMFPEACERIFLELLSNAIDGVRATVARGGQKGIIIVTLDGDTVSVYNEGDPVPVEFHEKYEVWTPQLAFGELRASSHFEETKRQSAGKNGYGSKLVNIYSDKFMVEIGDAKRRLRYLQVWRDNMMVVEPPHVEDYFEKRSFVRVTYRMDFARFGYRDGYPEEAFPLFGAHAVYAAFCLDTPVILRINGKEWTFDQDSLVNFISPREETTVNRLEKTVEVEDQGDAKALLLDLPDQGFSLSFVNGLITKEGGVHLQSFLGKISRTLLPELNKGLKKGKLTEKNIRPHLGIMLSCWLSNTVYTGQAKSKLVNPRPEFEDIEGVESLKKWRFYVRLEMDVDLRNNKLLMLTDGKKKKNVSVPKLLDANKAGGALSSRCTLLIVEGDSAKNYVNILVDHLEGGRDFYGILPIRGKILNVVNADLESIHKNVEIRDIKTAVGLRTGEDYTTEESLKTLRYGNIQVIADADVDGVHIVALMTNLFSHMFPGLIESGRLAFGRTPILRDAKDISTKFYSLKEYEEWSKTHKKKIKVKYYKGLGSSSEAEPIHDAAFFKETSITLTMDPEGLNYISLLFNQNLSDNRKVWMELSRNLPEGDLHKSPLGISEFVKNEVIHYSLLSLTRSIPGMDGLKNLGRKYVYGTLHMQWPLYASVGKNIQKFAEMKSASFFNAVASKYNYHHGDKSLYAGLNMMIVDFPGSNNLPYYRPEGLFGDRSDNGKKPAQPRYTAVAPMWWLPYVFREEDELIYTFVFEDGEYWEPEELFPIVPMFMINGAKGIGTGYSTDIPCYDPLDIVQWILDWLEEKTPSPLIPWYRGFKGSVTLLERASTSSTKDAVDHGNYMDVTKRLEQLQSRKKRRRRLKTDLSTDGSVVLDEGEKNARMVMKTTGVVVEGAKGKYIITELPIGLSINACVANLARMRDEKKSLKAVNPKNLTDDLAIEIVPEKSITLEQLGLVRCKGLTNLVLLKKGGRGEVTQEWEEEVFEKKMVPLPVSFSSIEEMMNTWMIWRLFHYQRRKVALLKSIAGKIEHCDQKIRYIELVNAGKIKLQKRSLADIKDDLDRLEFPHEFLNMSMRAMSREGLEDLKKDLDDVLQEQKTLQEDSPRDLWKKDLLQFRMFYQRFYK